MLRGLLITRILYRYAVKHPVIWIVCVCLLLYAALNITRNVMRNKQKKSLKDLPAQASINYLSKHLDVHVHVFDNMHADVTGHVAVRLTLGNTGDVRVSSGRWSIYLYSIIEQDGTRCGQYYLHSVKCRDDISRRGFSLNSPEKLNCGLEVSHVNGGLFRLVPDKEFPGIAAGNTIECTLHQIYGSVSRTQYMPNWYVASTDAGTSARVIQSTQNESLQFVGAYNSSVQWKRETFDLYNPYTPDQRFSMHERIQSIPTESLIVPTPLTVTRSHTGAVKFNRDNWVVVSSEDFPNESTFLSDKLQINVKKTKPASRCIHFTKKTGVDYDPEWYSIEVTAQPEVIHVTSGTEAGAFYGVQSVISLIEGGSGEIPVVDIDDKPRFRYRGLMIDSARNFHPKHAILKFIEVISAYKMNRLHLHLTDDEGWRIEIPGLPELTEVGSKRCHSLEPNRCLTPALGSGPDTSTSGSGYYSAADYREILRYANKHHVTVIPEIDMPGHSRSAVFSMSKRSEQDKQNPLHIRGIRRSYNLVDDEGVGFGNWIQNTINPCLNSTYMFVNKILDELILLHRGVQDLRLFHIGGDEVNPGVWDSSPSCRHLTVDNSPISTAQLKMLFVHTVANIAANKGLSIGAWEDGMYSDGPYPRFDFKNRDVYVYPWANIWNQRKGGRAVEFADAGYKVILAPATHLYLDHPYEPDPEERGLYWATRYTDTRRIFGFVADDIFKNADVDSYGKPLELNDFCDGGECPKTIRPENIIGLQACIWSETIRNERQLQYMAFPRLLAVAERAWHKPAWEDIENQGFK